MARLPDTLPVTAPRGDLPSTATVEPSDLGLTQAGEQLRQVGAEQQQTRRMRTQYVAAANADAAKALLRPQVVEPFEQTFAADAQAYDGSPGFAAKQLKALDDIRTHVMTQEGLTPDLSAALEHQFDLYKADVGDRAIRTEAAFAQGRVQATQDVQLSTSLANHQARFAAISQPRDLAFDGTQADYASGKLADFDQASAEILQAAPPAIQPRLEAGLAAQRVQVGATAIAAQQHGFVAHVVTAAADNVDTIANAVQGNPSQLDTAYNNLNQVASTVPAGQREQFTRHGRQAIAGAYISGLIQQGSTGLAVRALESGRFDTDLEAGQKQALLAQAHSANTVITPTSEDGWAAQQAMAQRMEAEVASRANSGKSTGLSVGEVGQVMGVKPAADFQERLIEADKLFAATGSMSVMSDARLDDHVRSLRPTPGDPDYARKEAQYEAAAKTAAAEKGLRATDPGGWAMQSQRPGDAGDQLATIWTLYQREADPAKKASLARQFAGLSLMIQAKGGIPAPSMRVLPDSVAKNLVQTVKGAPPDQRAAALQGVAATIRQFPTLDRLPSGEQVPARAVIADQLTRAGLSPMDLSAVQELGGDPVRMHDYVAAVSDPAAAKNAAGRGVEATLEAQVRTLIKPYSDSVAHMGGADALAQGRYDRVLMTARHLMTTQGLSARDAAKAAAGDLADGYLYLDHFRMPVAVAHQAPGIFERGIGGVFTGGPQLARQGALDTFNDMKRDGFSGFGAATTNAALSDADKRRFTAQQVADHGQWRTTADDTGLQLMVPSLNGRWQPVIGSDSLPVQRTWRQLWDRAQQDQVGAVVGRVAGGVTPPGILHGIEGQESRGRNGLVSPRGALGVMGLMPDTVARYAPRVGLPVDLKRAQWDADYNRTIGKAAWEHSLETFGGNTVLALAGYNAGEGAVLDFIRGTNQFGKNRQMLKLGDPRTGEVTNDAWLARFPWRETREYVPSVLARAYR